MASRFIAPTVCIILFLVALSVFIGKPNSGTSVPQPSAPSVVLDDSSNVASRLESTESETSATENPGPQEVGNDNETLIAYEVLDSDDSPPFKVSYDLRVDITDGRLPTKEELEKVSKHLRSREQNYERMFVLFYLPGMTTGSGAYATAHHTPQFEGVRILTMSVPKELQHLIDPRASKRSPTHCNNLLELAELYPGDLIDFKVVSESNTPHFEITCSTIKGEPQSAVDFEIRSSLALAVAATFVHTDYNSIEITVVPNELDVEKKQFTRQETESTTLAISKDAALVAYQSHVGIDSYSDLFGGMMDDTYFPDLLSPRFAGVLSDESNVRRLYDDLSSRGKSSEAAAVSRTKAKELRTTENAKRTDEKKKAEEEAARWRTWKDSSGKHSTEARYSGIALGKVILTKRDGKRVKVPLEKLSQQDQEWIKARSKK